MDNLALKIIDESIEEKEFHQPGGDGFKITDDSSAEWALKKIAESRAETQRYINVCQTMINEYQEKIRKAQSDQEWDELNLKSKLQEYFNSVPHRKTETQEQYKLPSGTLKLKYQQPQYIRDQDKLVKSLKAMGATEYIKTQEVPKWSDLKERIKVVGDKIVDSETGEIIEGVTVVDRPPVFEIDV